MEYTYIFVAEDEDGSTQVFRADGASGIRKGDFIESQEYFYTITEIVYAEVDGDTYRALAALGPIISADKIYSLAWKNKEEM